MASIFTRILNGEIPCYKIAEDENFKKAIETMKLIDDLASEFKDKDSIDQEHD